MKPFTFTFSVLLLCITITQPLDLPHSRCRRRHRDRRVAPNDLCNGTSLQISSQILDGPATCFGGDQEDISSCGQAVAQTGTVQ